MRFPFPVARVPAPVGLPFAAAVIAFAACGEDEEGLPGIPLEQFTQEFQGATCEHLVACNFMPDAATCLAIVPPEPGIVQSVASVNAGELSYDPAAARSCVEALRSAACTGDFLISSTVRKTCDSVFGNRKAEGESCYHAAECQGLHALCEGACDDSCCLGTCRLEAGFAEIGEACDMVPCVEDAWCRGGNPTICEAKVGPGDSCAASPTACPTGYACDPATETCFKQADPDGACNPDLQADGCGHIGQYCDAKEKKCLAHPEIGEPCATNAFAANQCAAGYAFCDGMSLTCVALPREGEPCPNSVCMGNYLGSGIPDGLACEGGVCVKVAAVPACVGP